MSMSCSNIQSNAFKNSSAYYTYTHIHSVTKKQLCIQSRAADKQRWFSFFLLNIKIAIVRWFSWYGILIAYVLFFFRFFFGGGGGLSFYYLWHQKTVQIWFKAYLQPWLDTIMVDGYTSMFFWQTTFFDPLFTCLNKTLPKRGPESVPIHYYNSAMFKQWQFHAMLTDQVWHYNQNSFSTVVFPL